MPQTARQVHEVSTSELSADQTAWNAAAVSRKFVVHDGQVWIYNDGALAPLPAISGFASLDPAVRGLVFQATAQFLRYRVGQTLSGTSLSGALAKAISGGDVPDAKSNDAFEAAYMADIEDRVTAKLGALGEKPSTEDRAKRRVVIEATAEKYRSQLFDSARDAAILAGESLAATRETKRKPSAKKEAALEL